MHTKTMRMRCARNNYRNSRLKIYSIMYEKYVSIRVEVIVLRLSNTQS